jgi:hypothetical protein
MTPNSPAHKGMKALWPTFFHISSMQIGDAVGDNTSCSLLLTTTTPFSRGSKASTSPAEAEDSGAPCTHAAASSTDRAAQPTRPQPACHSRSTQRGSIHGTTWPTKLLICLIFFTHPLLRLLQQIINFEAVSRSRNAQRFFIIVVTRSTAH